MKNEITDEKLLRIGYCTWKDYQAAVNAGEDYFHILQDLCRAEYVRRGTTTTPQVEDVKMTCDNCGNNPHLSENCKKKPCRRIAGRPDYYGNWIPMQAAKAADIEIACPPLCPVCHKLHYGSCTNINDVKEIHSPTTLQVRYYRHGQCLDGFMTVDGKITKVMQDGKIRDANRMRGRDIYCPICLANEINEEEWNAIQYVPPITKPCYEQWITFGEAYPKGDKLRAAFEQLQRAIDGLRKEKNT